MSRRLHHARSRPRGPVAWIAGAAVALVAAAAGVAVAATVQGEDFLAQPSPSPSPSASPSPSPTPPPTPSPSPPPEPQPVSFTFVAAGDVLPHSPVNASARSGNSYDYSPLFAGVTPFISSADLAICHLETAISPDGRYSGYPLFSAPPQLVRDLGRSGWDGCSTASNHTLDRGWDGVVETLDTFEANRLGATGSARSASEATAQMYTVRNGLDRITVANISYSYGTNGLPIPSGKPYAINVFNANASDAAPIINAAQAARDAGADVVIASVHCCVEYRVEPTGAQRELAERIAASGLVDLYVGHHAHVPQPIEKLPGGPTGDGMWVAFGLGNFVSNQSRECCVALTEVGVLLSATITVPVDGPAEVGVEWTGTTVDRLNGHRVYVLSDIQDGEGRISASEAQARLARVADAVGSQAPQRTTAPEPLADAAYYLRRGPWTP